MAEEYIRREKYIKFIERLYCKCGKDKLYSEYRDYISMKNFAASIGAEFYSTNENFHKIDENLANLGLLDLLPGHKRQLIVQGSLGEVLLDELYQDMSCVAQQFGYEIPTRVHTDAISTSDVESIVENLKGRNRYYVCKSCCTICRHQTRGCSLHCRDNFCDYISKMALIDVRNLIRRAKKPKTEVMKKYNDYMNDKIKRLPRGTNTKRSKGYFRSYFDIAEFIYIRFEVGFDYVYNLIEPLLIQAP